MKKVLLIVVMMLYSTIAFAQDNVIGFWTTIDDETKQPKSVVQIYEYNGHYFGRVVDVLKNKQATAKIPGNPPIIGLDIIWDLKKDGNKYTGGKILDPQKGKVYGCEIWREKVKKDGDRQRKAARKQATLDVMDVIRELKALYDEELITEAEYNEKKEKLLKKI